RTGGVPSQDAGQTPHEERIKLFSSFNTFAKEFDAIVISTESQLVKDRVAQKMIMKKNINFLETQYFYSYADMELWVERYVDVRKYILNPASAVPEAGDFQPFREQ
ncbi:hypothetical protein ACTXQV_54950, partial [Klebsiella pneumoniae]